MFWTWTECRSLICTLLEFKSNSTSPSKENPSFWKDSLRNLGTLGTQEPISDSSRRQQKRPLVNTESPSWYIDWCTFIWLQPSSCFLTYGLIINETCHKSVHGNKSYCLRRHRRSNSVIQILLSLCLFLKNPRVTYCIFGTLTQSLF